MIITILRKPLEGSVVENTLKHGCGAINIDATRITTSDSLGGGRLKGPTDMSQTCGGSEWDRPWMNDSSKREHYANDAREKVEKAERLGRWPANFILVGDKSVKEIDRQSGRVKGYSSQNHKAFNPYQGNSFHNSSTQRQGYKEGYDDDGGASRFFKQFNKKEDN